MKSGNYINKKTRSEKKSHFSFNKRAQRCLFYSLWLGIDKANFVYALAHCVVSRNIFFSLKF